VAKIITAKAYAKLVLADRDWYYPFYEEYKEKRVRAYDECDCCGSKTYVGWETVKEPVGPPKYKKHTRKSYNSLPMQMSRYYARRFVDMSSAVIDKTLIVGSSPAKISFTQYSPLGESAK
jgi:hypothetical protein